MRKLPLRYQSTMELYASMTSEARKSSKISRSYKSMQNYVKWFEIELKLCKERFRDIYLLSSIVKQKDEYKWHIHTANYSM